MGSPAEPSRDEDAAETRAVLANVTLTSEFAEELPQLAIAAKAAVAPQATTVVLNSALANELGLDRELLESNLGPEFLTGQVLATGSIPLAQLYSGHQFGGYSPILGDGRAMLLGEIHAPDGRTLDLHLKGSGPTMPARGDGFAALGPMLREYLVSEAMHALGVPTTRSLAVVRTGRHIHRDDYLRDDRLPGAVLARVAASHLRVGSFQLARARGDSELTERLVNFAIERHYPWLQGEDRSALGLFREVVRAQAQLTARWMLIGFVHGVMNTDNVTISGETIDYGPCAFIDSYDPAAVFSSIDHGGRYAFGSQPSVAKWNLARFAESLLPLFTVETAKQELNEFDLHFARAWADGMAAKLGLRNVDDDAIRALAEELFALLAEGRVDYTVAFRRLTDTAADPMNETAARTVLAGEGAGCEDREVRAEEWLRKWAAMDPGPESMLAVNPVTIPRNHLLAEALEAATDGDLQPFTQMLDAVMHPYEVRDEWQQYANPPAAGNQRFVSYCGT